MAINKPPVTPKFSWENLKINDDLGTVDGKVDEGAVLAHAFAIGENPEFYLRGFPGVGAFVPPSLLVNDLLKLFLVGYDCTEFGSAGGLHTKSLITYHAPLPIGAEVSITGSHIAKFVRKGRRHRSVLSSVKSEGKLIAEMLATETVGYSTDNGPDQGEMPANWAASLPKVESVIPNNASQAVPGKPVTEGMVIGPIKRWVGIEQSVIFSGYPFSWAQDGANLRQGLHTNYEIANRAGYPVPVVQGLMSVGHLSSMLLRQFGVKFFEGSQLALNFVSPVLVGTQLSSHALVIPNSMSDSHVMYELSLISQDNTGKIATAGYAKVPR